ESMVEVIGSASGAALCHFLILQARRGAMLIRHRRFSSAGGTFVGWQLPARTKSSAAHVSCRAIVRAKIDLALAKQQSPTTNEFFILNQIQTKTHSSHKRFKALLHQAIGIR